MFATKEKVNINFMTNKSQYFDWWLLQVTALAVIPMDMDYGILVAALIVGGFIFFFVMAKVGERIMRAHENRIIEASPYAESRHNGHDNTAIEIS